MKKYISFPIVALICITLSVFAADKSDSPIPGKLDLEGKYSQPIGKLLNQIWICNGATGKVKNMQKLFEEMKEKEIAIVLEPYHWDYTPQSLDSLVKLAQTVDIVVDTIHGTMDGNGHSHARNGFFVVHNTPSSRKFFSILETYESKRGEVPITGHPNAFSAFISHFQTKKLPDIGALLKVQDLNFPLPLTWQETPREVPLILGNYQRVKPIGSSPQASPGSGITWFSAKDKVIINKKDTDKVDGED